MIVNITKTCVILMLAKINIHVDLMCTLTTYLLILNSHIIILDRHLRQMSSTLLLSKAVTFYCKSENDE